MRMRMTMTMAIINKIFFSEQNTKMSYYLFNREEILEKAQKRYSKEKAAEYYLQKKEKVIKEKARNRYKNFSKEEKNKIKEYQKKRYQELIQYKKEALKDKLFCLYEI